MKKRDKLDKMAMIFRTVGLSRENIDEEKRTVSLAFSSEEPVERYFGLEVLDHSPKSVRLGRLKSGGPVLVDHDSRDLVGVVERVTIDADRIGRAVVRLGTSARAEEIFTDLRDGIRSKVSVGYRIHRADVANPEADTPTYRATDWEPFEISLVSVPADDTVGVGRAIDEVSPFSKILDRVKIMDDDKKIAAALAAAEAAAVVDVAAHELRGVDRERARVAEIMAIGEQYQAHGARELSAQAVRDNWDVAKLNNELVKKMSSRASEGPGPQIGMSDGEVREYSISRALRALAAGKWEDAGLERAAHEAAIKAVGREPQNGGIFIPYDVQRRQSHQIDLRQLARAFQDPGAADKLHRDMTVATGSAGGFLVQTSVLGASFIDLLRARSKVLQLGGMMLPGLKDSVTIPKLSASSTLFWLTNEATAITESTPTLAQVSLSPKNAGVYVEASRQLLMQSSPAADALIMTDIARTIGTGVDAAALNGSGAAGQPTGIIGTAGIGAVTGTTLAWAGIVEFETDVASANADVASMAYLTTPAVKGVLKTREKATGTGNFDWGGVLGDNTMNGYRADHTTNMPAANMLFGDWSQVMIAEWGALELAVNPYANFPAGLVGFRGFISIDIGVRNAGAFSLATAIT